MCYNCGCQLPDDDMGKGHAGADPTGKAITNKTFKEAADAFGMSEEDARKNVYEMLSKEFNKKQE